MILVNGASYAYGDYLLPGDLPWPKLLFGDLCNNIAQIGSSNQSIFRRTIEELYLNPQTYTMVLIEWTALYRFEWADTWHQPKTFLLTESSNKGTSAAEISEAKIIKELIVNWHSEFWYYKQFLILLSNLKLHCKNLDIPCYFFNSNIDVVKCYTNDTYNDFDKFSKLFDNLFHTSEKIKQEYEFLQTLKEQTADCWILPPTQSMHHFCTKHFVSEFNPHPTQTGHQIIADQLSLLLKSKAG
jgi:hypothetical protein